MGDERTHHTMVQVNFNGATNYHEFDIEFEEFKYSFKNHTQNIGYYIGEDKKGNMITLCPNQCGSIEISKRIRIEG